MSLPFQRLWRLLKRSILTLFGESNGFREAPRSETHETITSEGFPHILEAIPTHKNTKTPRLFLSTEVGWRVPFLPGWVLQPN